VKIDGYDVTCIFNENPNDGDGTFSIGDGKKPSIDMEFAGPNPPENYVSNFTIPERVTYKEKTYILTHVAKFGLSNTNFTNILFNFSNSYSYDRSLVLGDSAFENSTYLEEVNLRFTGIKEFSERCFYNCTNLSSIIPGRNLEAFKPMSLAFTAIPSIKIGARITSIGYFLFLGSRIEEVDMEAFPLEIIPVGLFEGCNKLTKVTLPTSLKTLPERCFLGSVIKNVVFPSGLTTILEKCFQYCKALETIDLSNTCVESLPNECFSHTPSLKTVLLPKGLKTLSTGVFTDSALKEIVLPAKISSMSDRVFSYCTQLETVDLSNTSIAFIPRSGFYECRKLKKVYLPKTCTKICELAFASTDISEVDFSHILEMEQQAFKCCYSIKEIDLSKFQGGLITKELFGYCSNASSLILPDQITFIEEYAFVATAIRKIVLPEKLIGVKEGAFSKIKALEEIDFSKTKVSNFSENMFLESGDFNIIWPLSCENKIALGKRMFYNSEISTITLPENCSCLPEEIFAGCKKLRIVDLSQSKINFIKGYAFTGTHIDQIKFGSGTYEFGHFGFYGAFISNFTMPRVFIVHDNSFHSCKGFNEVIFPEGLILIGNQAFNSSDVKKITLPSSISSIGYSAFCNCQDLVFVNMSISSIALLRPYSFSGNPSIEEFYLPYKIKNISNDAFLESKIEKLYFFGIVAPSFLLGTLKEPEIFVTKEYRGKFFNGLEFTRIDRPSYIPKIDYDGPVDDQTDSDALLSDTETRRIIRNIVIVVSIAVVICLCTWFICLCDPYEKKGSSKVEIEYSLDQNSKSQPNIGWTKPLSE
jgi:hypothetical protein